MTVGDKSLSVIYGSKLPPTLSPHNPSTHHEVYEQFCIQPVH